MFTNGTPTLPSTEQNLLRQTLQQHFEHLVFRRVGSVGSSNKNFQQAHCFKFDVEKEKACSLAFGQKDIPQDQEKIFKEWELHYSSFFGFAERAGPHGIRDSDSSPNVEIYFNSKTYAELDIATLEWANRPRSILPQKGELICGLVQKSGSGRKPHFTKWFNCSEQFLRFWTLVMYDHHDAFQGKAEKRLKGHFLSGNRLNTNSFSKWYRSLKDNGSEISKVEVDKRYYRLRTEFTSSNWIHVYSAMALMARWGEVPCKYNIPRNRGNGPKVKHWNLPKDFVSSILSKWTNMSPEAWNYTCWTDLELEVNKEFSEYVQPKKEAPVFSVADFPPLANTQKQVWSVKDEVEPPPATLQDLFSNMDSSEHSSWADIMDEEEEEFTDSEPSEGGLTQPVNIVIVSEKSGFPSILGTFAEKEKALQKLKDWVLLETDDGHWSDPKSRLHSTSGECELCSLRKFKTLSTLEATHEVTLWDSRVGSVTEQLLE